MLRRLILFFPLFCALPALAQRPAAVQQALQLSDLRARVEALTAELTRAPSASAYLWRAEAYSMLALHDLARRDLDHAQASSTPSPREPDFLIQAVTAELAYNAGDARAAFDAADRAFTLPGGQYAYARLLRAQAGVALQRYAEAQTDARIVLSTEPGNLSALIALADAQQGLREPEAALATIDRALEVHPRQPALTQRKLLWLDRLGRREQVEALAADLIAFAAQDPLSLSNLGIVFQNAGDLPRALDYHTRALALYTERMQDPAFARSRSDQVYDIYVNRGTTHQRLGKNDQALADFTRAAQLRPQRYEAHFLIGELQVAQRNYREAIVAYEACFARNPTLPDGWVNLSFAYMELGRRPEALSTFDRALKLPNLTSRAMLLNNRGFCHLELGHRDQARADLESAIAVDPRVGMAHISLGEYYLTLGEFDAARAKFDYAERLPFLDARERWTLYYQRGGVALRQGRPADAATDLEAAIAADPSFNDAHERLGQAREALGQWCAARAAYRRALDLPRRMYADPPLSAALLLTRLDVAHPQPCP